MTGEPLKPADPRATMLPCQKDDDPNRWFTSTGAKSTNEPNRAYLERVQYYMDAKKACMGCPINLKCLEMGLEPENLKYGIWGGADPEERAAIHRRQRRAQAHQ